MTLCQDLMMDTHCWGLTWLLGVEVDLTRCFDCWLTACMSRSDKCRQNIGHEIWDDSRHDLCSARALVLFSMEVMLAGLGLSLLNVALELLGWKDYVGQTAGRFQLSFATIVTCTKKHESNGVCFCARLERLLVRSGGDEIARSDDLIAVIQDGSFHGMTVAPEAFELFYHGLPRWSARACELLKLQNLC